MPQLLGISELNTSLSKISQGDDLILLSPRFYNNLHLKNSHICWRLYDCIPFLVDVQVGHLPLFRPTVFRCGMSHRVSHVSHVGWNPPLLESTSRGWRNTWPAIDSGPFEATWLGKVPGKTEYSKSKWWDCSMFQRTGRFYNILFLFVDLQALKFHQAVDTSTYEWIYHSK